MRSSTRATVSGASHLAMAAAACLTVVATGCATFCTMSDTGMHRMRPYGGVRATITDWEGCSEKPWDNLAPWQVIPYKAYFRTIDLPVSLVADTWMLPFVLSFGSDSE